MSLQEPVKVKTLEWALAVGIGRMMLAQLQT